MTPRERAHDDRSLEQRLPDAQAAMALRDHQAEVGDVVARGVRVTADREPPDDPLLGFGDVDGGVRVAAERAQVPALVAHGPPVRGRDQPAARLGADLVRERDERGGVAGLGGADGELAAHAARLG